MNAESSRSHAVLIARIIREKKATKERSTAKLFLVDLAGSERIGKSGVTGVALEEAKAINLSLSTLGLCIKALVDPKKPHVPFRSSKLTRLLKESLGMNIVFKRHALFLGLLLTQMRFLFVCLFVFFSLFLPFSISFLFFCSQQTTTIQVVKPALF